MPRLGIYGGSFDPVHNGHIAAARAFIAEAELASLAVVPAFLSPFKSRTGASAKQRAEMLSLAFSGDKNISVDEFELASGGVSYTCETIAHFRKLYPDFTLCYLIGDDCLEKFFLWRDYRFILDNCLLYVANRSGGDLESAVEKFSADHNARAFAMKYKAIAVSSAEIRACPNKALLPDAVYDYIIREGLYK